MRSSLSCDAWCIKPLWWFLLQVVLCSTKGITDLYNWILNGELFSRMYVVRISQWCPCVWKLVMALHPQVSMLHFSKSPWFRKWLVYLLWLLWKIWDCVITPHACAAQLLWLSSFNRALQFGLWAGLQYCNLPRFLLLIVCNSVTLPQPVMRMNVKIWMIFNDVENHCWKLGWF